MRFRCSHALIILIGIVLNGVANAASAPNSWTSLMIQGKHMHNPAYYIAAANVAERFGPHDPRLHIALHNAALQSEASHASLSLIESLFRKDIACLELLDTDFPDIVSDCFQLSRVYMLEQRYAQSEPLLLRALAIRKKWQDTLGQNVRATETERQR